MLCPICLKGRLYHKFQVTTSWRNRDDRFSVSVCNFCGCGKTLPDLDRNQLWQYYPKEYEFYSSLLPSFFNGLAHRIYFDIHRHLFSTTTYILDIGCGDGSYLKFLMDRGYKVAGVDTVEIARKIAKTKEIPIIKANTSELIDDYKESFDCITLWWTLEHENDPSELLSDVYRLLKSSGWLIIEVPNFISLESTIFRQYWFLLDIPRHRFHYTAIGLKELLKRAGFKTMRFKMVIFDPGYVMGSILCIAERLFGMIMPMRAKKLVMYIFCLPGIVCGFISAVFKKGGSIVIKAQKV